MNVVSRCLSKRTDVSCIVVMGLAVLGLAQPALAQDPTSTKASQPQDQATKQRGAFQSGYEQVPEFGGPGSVRSDLKEDDAVKKTVYRFEVI